MTISKLGRITCAIIAVVCAIIVAVLPAAAGTAVLDGHVEFKDYTGSNWLLPVEIQFSQNDDVLRTERVFPDASGSFTISGIDAGTYGLTFSAVGCLRKVIPAIQFSNGVTTPVNVSLENGDVNGDNSVGLKDLSIVSANYGQQGQQSQVENGLPDGVNFWFSLKGNQSPVTDVDLALGQTLELSLWYQTIDSFAHNAVEVLVGYDTTTSEGPYAVPLDNQVTLDGSPIVDTTLFNCILLNDEGGGYGPSGPVRPYGAHLVISKFAGTVTANIPIRLADFTVRNRGVTVGGSYMLGVYNAPDGTNWTSAIAHGLITYRDATPAVLNIHGAPPLPVSIADAKELADGNFVSCSGKIVTAIFANGFYIEEPDRSSGIRVVKPGFAGQVGDSVSVTGLMAKDDLTGERFIDATDGTVETSEE